MTTTRRRHLKVFLCHASGDKPQVHDLYKRLVASGIDAWLDQEKLMPGQDWRLEIPRAVREVDVVVICLSNRSITKEGYVQKEIKFALDVAQEKPEGSIFIIPARLEDCEVPEQLSQWQWVDLFSEDGYERLIKSLQSRAKDIHVSAVKIKVHTRRKDSKTREEAEETSVERKNPVNVRRLDAAMPKESTVNQTTEVRVLVALRHSKGLRAYLPDYTVSRELISKADVEAVKAPVIFPYDPDTGRFLPAHLQVVIDAPGFRVTQPVQQLLIPPDRDSGMLTFLLTPLITQAIGRVSVKLYLDEDCTILLGSVTLTTKVSSKGEKLSTTSWHIVTIPLAREISMKIPIAIIVAMIGAVATIVAALIGIVPEVFNPFNSTPVIPSPTPFCISADDILVRLHIKNQEKIDVLAPFESIFLEPELTVDLQVEISSTTNKTLPTLECAWINTGIATEGRLLHKVGCNVDYKSGRINVLDALSLQISQPSCPALPPYAFFISP